MKKLLGAVITFSLVAIVATPVAAQEASVSGTGDNIAPAFVHLSKKQTKVTIDQAITSNTIPAFTLVAIDAPKSLSCGLAPCVISDEITWQLIRATTAVTQVYFAFVVDGSTQPGSTFFSEVLDQSVYQMAHQRITTTSFLSPGAHTVQSFGAATAAATRSGAFYSVMYTQLK